MLGNLNSPQNSTCHNFFKPANPIAAEDFRVWTSNNHYRTSKNDMESSSPPKNKTYAVPGYKGVIPGTKSDNNFGKTFTKISREQFTREIYLPTKPSEFFPNRPVAQTSMGRTLGKFGGGLDDEYHTVSCFHGKSTLCKEHPNYVSDPWTTTTKGTYKNQAPERKHIFRTSKVEKWKRTLTCQAEGTKSSGFIKNWLACDGKGWLPIKAFHGDMMRTEYRMKYNHEVPFHPKPLHPNVRTLKKTINLAS